ncbi:MAG TPA: hypothetical protein VHJ79_09320, partial [Mycobacterium sp.]|nr:hypothetical protein [Mycobacterium sp.]
MSRTPQPNAIKVLRGTRASRLNVAEVPVLDGELTPPRWLTPEASAYFTELRDEFAPGAIAAIDRHALAMLAEAFADMARAGNEVRTCRTSGTATGNRGATRA